MATTNEVIEKLTIVTTAPGTKEADAALKGLKVSAEGVAVAEQKRSVAHRTSASELERSLASHSQAIRIQQHYQKELERNQRFEQYGIGTAQQRAMHLQFVNERYIAQTAALKNTTAANDNFSKVTGIAGYQVRNLGFQLNDVATMLAMGASPFQILASQGGQVYQILASSEKGVIGAIKGSGRRLSASWARSA